MRFSCFVLCFYALALFTSSVRADALLPQPDPGKPAAAQPAENQSPKPGSHAPSTAPDTAKAEVADLDKALWAAVANRDLWSVSAIWDQTNPKISAIFPASANPALGWGNIAENYRRTFFHNRDIKTDSKIIRMEQQGDVIWLIAAVRFEAVQTQTSVPILMDRMLVTEIFQKRDGQWRLVHYHGHYPKFLPPYDSTYGMNVSGVLPPREASPVWDVYDKFEDGFGQLSLATMFDVFASERSVSALQPTSPVPFLGPENVMASWKKTFADIQSLSLDPQSLSIVTVGDVAWVVDLSQYHIIFNDRPKEVRHFHYVLSTFIFTKNDGEWHIAHYHSHLGFSFDEHDHGP